MGWESVAIGRPKPGSGQNLTTGTSSVQSAAFGSETYAIAVSGTAAFRIALGLNPTATASDLLIGPNLPPCILRVVPGEKIAVIEDSASGTVSVVEMDN